MGTHDSLIAYFPPAITLPVKGLFDIGAGFRLFNRLQMLTEQEQTVILDLADADLRDSGLGWLIMLNKRLKAKGKQLLLLHCGVETERRWHRVCEDYDLQELQ